LESIAKNARRRRDVSQTFRMHYAYINNALACPDDADPTDCLVWDCFTDDDESEPEVDA